MVICSTLLFCAVVDTLFDPTYPTLHMSATSHGNPRMRDLIKATLRRVNAAGDQKVHFFFI